MSLKEKIKTVFAIGCGLVIAYTMILTLIAYSKGEFVKS